MVAIDGTKFFGSNKKSCPECSKNSKGEKTHCFHSGTVMSTVGMGPKLVIGFEMYKPGEDSVSKDEGELNVAKKLISSVVKSHKKLMDIVVYDALACNSIWINHCRNLGIDAIVRAKIAKRFKYCSVFIFIGRWITIKSTFIDIYFISFISMKANVIEMKLISMP